MTGADGAVSAVVDVVVAAVEQGDEEWAFGGCDAVLLGLEVAGVDALECVAEPGDGDAHGVQGIGWVC